MSFEIYNPYSIVQLSEVLKDFKIRLNGRLIYEGQAVVSGLVNTGVLLVCEVTLAGGWKDVDFLAQSQEGGSLVTQFDDFVDDWNRAHQVSSDFKINVADMQNLMIGVKRWLEQIDLGIRSTDTEDKDGLEKQVISEIEERMMQEVNPLMSDFEASTRKVSLADQPAHKFYVRRHMHPLMLCSPFAYRAFSKPLGYAGDYEMVNMMLRDPYEGGTLFAKMLNRTFLSIDPVQAHRNRIDYLVENLKSEAQKAVSEGRRLKVLNLGCGPAQEIQRFVKNEEISDQCDFTLLDFNKETLDYTHGLLAKMKYEMGRGTNFKMIERSVHQLLKQASKGDVDMDWESYDMVYCAGLFDYLSQKVCKRLVELFTKLIRPGGMLITTNVASTNPRIGWMEYVVEWNLIYRNDWEMLDLIPLDGTILQTDLKRDATGVNLFLEIRKVAMDPIFKPTSL
ncbi:class I SAM-dependent methyltransferase [Verrucomicrobiaceae bacterium R5-34]|uniref:Class I SAM-dependent methyltransferase n=1 Tax=Oceaniferula flava TaxID=2800421 RepID=A0AAE2S9R2_9BACT|nr:class I SAM-dependent methyltransferase [Oceaniferula flavus]MBK1829207.1 class I SAM-dependent methyltransferase [Verrucomicrobiaceae bacterium R5-34]MBK1853444.1 class I SAM-dependent methyltransferase [Oceaniferula flavus]MBM1134749.1 class I SAM-dependent methyltransferase [Oceaniferula flavus]